VSTEAIAAVRLTSTAASPPVGAGSGVALSIASRRYLPLTTVHLWPPGSSGDGALANVTLERTLHDNEVGHAIAKRKSWSQAARTNNVQIYEGKRTRSATTVSSAGRRHDRRF
jgi:hypothetical protein